MADLITSLRTLVIALVVIFTVTGCSKGKIFEWGNKYTIVLETPDGNISAYSVVGEKLLDRRSNPQFGSGNVWSFAMKGEAVVLNLGETPKGPRYVFALVVRNQYLPFLIAGEALDIPVSNYAEIAGKFDQVDWPVSLVPKQYPLLVTFDDINDPASVKRVDPDDLDAAFGCPPSPSNAGAGQAEQSDAQNERGSSGGTKTAEEAAAQRPRGADASNEIGASGVSANKPCYTLKSITLEITDEPVTTGRVESVLGWLTWSREKLLAAGEGRNPVQLSINGGELALGRTDFRRK